MSVAPDQSLLVLDSDISGKWPLVRLKNWWTDTPAIEKLYLPGWSSVDAEHLASIRVDLQITPDGRYAIAFAGAVWMDRSSFLIHAPKGYIERKPDTIVTVVGLLEWKIIHTLHTIDIADAGLASGRIVNGKWLALDFSLGRSPLKTLLYRYDTRLLSLPDLNSGRSCISNRHSRLFPVTPSEQEIILSVQEHNDETCQDVLRATGTSSVEALTTIIQRGQDEPPTAVLQNSEHLKDTEDSFFEWGHYPYYLLYHDNPPFESSSRRWYGLYASQDRDLYDLTIFAADGRKEKSQLIDRNFCGDTKLDERGSACGCRVIDVSEPQQSLIAYCRTQRGDFEGTVRREWLGVLYVADLSPAGFISLNRGYRHETLEQIAIGDEKAYVVTLESGETLRVYAVPAHP